MYLEALSRLRDDVPPLDPGVAEKVVEDELGVRISSAFALALIAFVMMANRIRRSSQASHAAA
ncbi:MAG: hypothetical protein ACJ71Y_04170 [Blastococcus sp.]